ncbi:MAG TPA: amidinotransferase [Streptosporangiaceae bacterium]|nr:amidinotransferase [Streptosporangiaceae bacterium]
MCPPAYFEVTYSINPWMDPTKPVDKSLAMLQWQGLRERYEELGHQVDIISPRPGLPDMVFAANGGMIIDGRALVARFKYAERTAEAEAYLEWFRSRGIHAEQAHWINEGEGDILSVGPWILAGTGFRTDRYSHGEIEEFFGRPVISLTLVDERYYHLDTALAVLSDEEIAYNPAAFSPASVGMLRELFPDAILATAEDATVFGLNAVSDGRHVVLPAAATRLIEEIRERGFEPVGVDMSELLRAGGSAKCCTLEMRG